MEKDSKEHPSRITQIRKRDGRVGEFVKDRITDAIFEAAKAVGGHDRNAAEELADKVVTVLEFKFDHGEIPTVEEVQDIVEKVLIKSGHAKTAKEYILYRKAHQKLRETKDMMIDVNETISGYLDQSHWRVKENSNCDYSFSGLMLHTSGRIIANYTLNEIYTPAIAEAHKKGYFHLHDLSHGVIGYCAGWSLRKLLVDGFGNVPNKVDAKPAKHMDVVVSQMINFIGCAQMEFAGAQAFSSVDTYLAPFIKTDNLDYKNVRQNIQRLIFSLNIPSRWGSQMPFSNVTFDWIVPEDMKDTKAIVGGKEQDFTYGDCQKEMDMVNKAFLDLMLEGDAGGRIFTFPIPTYNITKDFDWDSENAKLLFDMTAKYGTPYFQNFINSTLKPGDVRSMCCRLQLDLKELKMRANGLFGAGEQTGSIGVVTINLSKIAYETKDKEEFFNKLGHYMELGKQSLEIKRKVITQNLNAGLMPYTRIYLGTFDNHFSTIGLIGTNEACMNMLGKEHNISTADGKEFAVETLNFMRDKLVGFQEETGNLYNLEATPAEGTSYRLARLDKEQHPEIITQGKEHPFYTNSSHLPVNHTDDLFEVLEHQDELQRLYTGGTVVHGFLGEKISNGEVCKQLVKRIAYSVKMPYFTITPTFSVCPVHGYLAGEHHICSKEHSEKEIKESGIDGKMVCEVYSRVVGYFRPVKNWNNGKTEEYKHRLPAKEVITLAHKETPIVV